MSHVVHIKTEVRDVLALCTACRRLGLAEPVHETVKLFSGEATGHCVRLPDWRYPVVCELATGQLAFDNFAGRWGDPCELDSLLQSYAVEKTRLEARKQGHEVLEEQLVDGSVKLTVRIGGVA